MSDIDRNIILPEIPRRLLEEAPALRPVKVVESPLDAFLRNQRLAIAQAYDELAQKINELNETVSLLATGETYTATNVTVTRTFDANATSIDEIADVLGTLLQDLRAAGIIL